MNLKKMMMASALLMVACCMQAQTKVIAHRGFWKTPGSSQNSISSLQKQIPSVVTVQNLTYGSLRITSWWSTTILYTR